MTIGDAKRILVTTFAAGAESQSTPEWVVPVSDTRVGFWTPDITEWRSRLSHTATVTVHECDARGKVVRSQPLFEGRAEVITDGPIHDEVTAQTKGKYGFGTTVAGLVDRVRELGGQHTPDGVVLINIVG